MVKDVETRARAGLRGGGEEREVGGLEGASAWGVCWKEWSRRWEKAGGRVGGGSWSRLEGRGGAMCAWDLRRTGGTLAQWWTQCQL